MKVSDGWNASKIPTRVVKISDGRTGTLSDKGTCKLVNGTCALTFRAGDNACGSVTLYAAFLGNAAFYKSAGSILISVYVSGGC